MDLFNTGSVPGEALAPGAKALNITIDNLDDVYKAYLVDKAFSEFMETDREKLEKENLTLQNRSLRLNMPSGYGETGTMAEIAPFLGAGIARTMPRPSHQMTLSDINLAKRFPELKEFVTKPRTGTWNIPGLEWSNSMKGPVHAPSNATSASSLISRLFRR